MRKYTLVLVGATITVAFATVTMLAETPQPTDPNVGPFTGTLKVTGVMDKGRVQPNAKCGNCHAEATVQRKGDSGYSLNLQIDDNGKLVKTTLDGTTKDGKLVFKNDKYELSLVDQKVTGKLGGPMQGDLQLTKAPSSQPSSRPKADAHSEYK